MKKILALILVVVLSALTLVACTPANTDKEYTLAVVVDHSFEGGKLSNIGAAIVFDKDGKVASARFDYLEIAPTALAGAVVVVPGPTKVEQGDAYNMYSENGSFAKQTKAFEDAIVGKTVDEVKNLDMTLVSGCTMPNSPATFKALVEKASESDAKITFKTSAESFKLGLSITGAFDATKSQVATEFAGVVVAEDKVAACVIDSNATTLSAAEDGTITAGEYAGTKNEQGDDYTGMDAGSWQKQARAFADAIVGLDAAGLASFAPVSDALAEAGCTMKSAAVYLANIVKAFGYAR